jgi:hypothetical protein
MADDTDFWNDLVLGQQSKTASSLDAYLQAREAESWTSGIRLLTDRGREAAALQVPVESGARVAFVTNIGSVLTYPDPPAPDALGTVVLVRTAEGDQTGMGDLVFVKFDDGKFLAIHREHLRRSASSAKRAASFVRRAASLGDLSGFLRWGSEDSTDLVHKATRDLWSFSQTDDGDFVITRLFNDTGAPIKV